MKKTIKILKKNKDKLRLRIIEINKQIEDLYLKKEIEEKFGVSIGMVLKNPSGDFIPCGMCRRSLSAAASYF